MSTREKQNTPRTRRSFTAESKANAVATVLDDGRQIVDVAETIGVGDGALGNWVRSEKIERGERAGLELRPSEWSRCCATVMPVRAGGTTAP